MFIKEANNEYMINSLNLIRNASFPSLDFDLTDKIRNSNVIRAIVIIPIAILISTSIIILNVSKQYAYTGLQNLWVKDILLLNESVTFILGSLVLISLLLRKSKLIKPYLSKTVILTVIIIIPFWGTMGCLLDQREGPSLISLLAAFIAVASGLLIRPWISILVFGLNYIIFYYCIAFTQSNPQLLEFNRSAALWCMLTSIGLSTIFWRNNLQKIKQEKIILDEKNELQLNYCQLVETTTELKKSIETKDHFFSILAHDLRGPLTSTLSLTQMITENSFGADENEKNNAMKLIENTLQKSIELFDDILVWSATQNNRMSFMHESLHLHDLVNNNIQLLMLGAHNKNLVVINHINGDFRINAHRNILNTILRNLLSNAIKFSLPGGKIEILADINSDKTTGNKIVTISVKDHGVGIEDKVLKNLFKIGHTTSTLGTNNEIGTGLGLILCKELAEKLNGSISVESKMGAGSKFLIHLAAT